MKYRETIDYPVSRERLLAIFTDPSFVVRKYQGQGASNIETGSSEQVGSRFRITVSRDVPVEVDVPSFARSLVPAAITLVQTDIWDTGTGKGSLAIEFQGMPVTLNCDMTLEAREDGGTHHVLDFDIRVSVPLIGKKLEELLASDLRMKFGKDTEVSKALIAGWR